MKKRLLIALISIVALLAGGFFYFSYQVKFSKGREQEKKVFEIKKGEGGVEVAERLEQEGLIASRIYFIYYLKTSDLASRIISGQFELKGSMTIPEIAFAITSEENLVKNYKVVLFKEGLNVKEMAAVLDENGFDGAGFSELVKKPEFFAARYPFLNNPTPKTLEGYLFPDTYFLGNKLDAEGIIAKMLDTFNTKVYLAYADEIEKSGKKWSELVTMASVIEKEVKKPDMKVVSGIFWNRISVGTPLQSCATIAYILGVNKRQYTFDDTRIESPYNTYINKGLPPAPIANPGVDSIDAAIHPTATDYFYFLSDPDTGKTIFSKTIEDHNANKVKYGL